jgi:DNA-binding FadR family transcriptional regulator
MESAVSEPIAFRTAELDFLAAVVDASHNTMLSHMGAVIRVALNSLPVRPASVQRGTVLHRAVLDAVRLRNATASEQAMSKLLDRDETLTTEEA